MELSIAEIADLVVKNNEINFVGFAITPWHLLGVESCINYLKKDKNLQINSGLVIMKHRQTGFALNESDVSQKDFKFVVKHNEKFVIKKEIIRFLQYIVFFFKKKKTSEDIYIACPAKLHLMFGNEIFRKTNKNIRFIITDEGVAQYMNTLFKGKGVEKKIAIYRSINSFFNRIFLKKGEVISHTLLQPTLNDEYVINQQVVDSYKKIIKNKYSEDCYPFDNNAILICTTAWKRDDIVNNEDTILLKKVIKICKQIGYKIYLKTHPRDKYFETIATEICDIQLDATVPVECVYCQSKLPKFIMSFSSTVLVTAKLFTEMQPICLTDLLERNRISMFYITEIDAFKNAFEKFVFFPNNFKKLTDKLNTKR